MSRSIRARVVSDLLKLWPKQSAAETELKIAEALRRGEKPCPPPLSLKTRHEDLPHGRVFYANENPNAPYTVMYLHGGAYFHDFILPHWFFLEKLIRETGAELIAPAYRLLPFATWEEAFSLLVPLYRDYAAAHPGRKIILMGESAGGGLSLALAECFLSEGIRPPDELILMSPWVDLAMENEAIPRYEAADPLLSVPSLRICARHWAGSLDLRDWRVSPVYGSLKGIRRVTVFVGTSEVFYPDITGFFSLLPPDPSNELIVGKEMNHAYPLFPIAEAKPALEKRVRIIQRDEKGTIRSGS